jgi:hypothetical protein
LPMTQGLGGRFDQQLGGSARNPLANVASCAFNLTGPRDSGTLITHGYPHTNQDVMRAQYPYQQWLPHACHWVTHICSGHEPPGCIRYSAFKDCNAAQISSGGHEPGWRNRTVTHTVIVDIAISSWSTNWQRTHRRSPSTPYAQCKWIKHLVSNEVSHRIWGQRRRQPLRDQNQA